MGFSAGRSWSNPNGKEPNHPRGEVARFGGQGTPKGCLLRSVGDQLGRQCASRIRAKLVHAYDRACVCCRLAKENLADPGDYLRCLPMLGTRPGYKETKGPTDAAVLTG